MIINFELEGGWSRIRRPFVYMALYRKIRVYNHASSPVRLYSGRAMG